MIAKKNDDNGDDLAMDDGSDGSDGTAVMATTRCQKISVGERFIPSYTSTWLVYK